MIISVINHTEGLLSDAEVQRAIRAINRQIAEDFAPVWDMSATLRLEGKSFTGRASPRSDLQHAVDMRGDAVIYLWHPVDVRQGLGFHAVNFLGIPYGFVFPSVSRALGEPWPVTLSHEALEILADPEVNLLVMGPRPGGNGMVFHWYEVCDAVQTEAYNIDGVPVSNFVLPLYFTNSEEAGSRNDFLSTQVNGRSLPSFGVNPGGYTGYFDPVTGEHGMSISEGDQRSLHRLQVKRSLGLTRRTVRYARRPDTSQTEAASIRSFLNSG